MNIKHLIISVLIISILAIYWQTGNHDFVNYDDPGYVYNNSQVIHGPTLDSMRWAFTTYTMGNWHPLTWFSHMLDCQLFGLNPRGHHLINVFLHITNTCFLFIVLQQITGAVWKSAFVAVLFALHPLHVESVAWVSGRKDLLSALFFMLILLIYAKYHKKLDRLRYGMLVALFVLGLLAKPMLVTVPFVLFVLDCWPLKRISATPLLRLLMEKIPLALISLLFIAIAVYTQHQNGVLAGTETIPLSYRIMNVTTSYTGYIAKTFWPEGLIVLYPLTPEIPVGSFLRALVTLVVVSATIFALRRSFPFLIVGWLWFLGMLLPVIGFTQIGIQAMADRYSYLPIIGLFIMLAWGVSALIETWQHSTMFLCISAFLICTAMACTSWYQIKHWQNSVTLLSHALHFTSAPLLHNNLALALAEQGRFDEAVKHLNKALNLNADYFHAYFNLGLVYEQQGKFNEAYHYYTICIQMNPDDKMVLAALRRISPR